MHDIERKNINKLCENNIFIKNSFSPINELSFFTFYFLGSDRNIKIDSLLYFTFTFGKK